MREFKFRLVVNGKIIGYEETNPNDCGNWFHVLYDGDTATRLCKSGTYSSFMGSVIREQFTSVGDAQDRDIYEGDYLRGDWRPHGVHRVYWDYHTNGFRLFLKEYGDAGPLKKDWIKEYKKGIIGNIHDNPELMEEK